MKIIISFIVGLILIVSFFLIFDIGRNYNNSLVVEDAKSLIIESPKSGDSFRSIITIDGKVSEDQGQNDIYISILDENNENLYSTTTTVASGTVAEKGYFGIKERLDLSEIENEGLVILKVQLQGQEIVEIPLRKIIK